MDDRITVSRLPESVGPPGRHLLPQLDRATVTAMRGKHFVVSDVELVRVGTQQFSYRQSWLCYALTNAVKELPPSTGR